MSPQQETADRRIPLLLAALAAFGVLALICPVVCGQEPAAGVHFTIKEVPRTGKLINVSVNKGVLVDFNVPLHEVRVANAAIADVAVTSPTQILVSGKSFGATQLVAWVEGGQQHIFDIAVDLDLDRLVASIRSAVPRARVEANSVLDTVVLTGTVPDAQAAQHIADIAEIYSASVVNHVRVAGVQQVLLRCTVAEVNRSATRRLGFNGWMAGDNFPDMFTIQQLSGINPANIGAAADAPVHVDIPFLTGTDGIPVTSATTLSFGFPRMQMQVFIQALRENGLLKILAEPNLVTISGQEASFLAGGEFPIPVPQGLNQSITIEYREFGVRLRFTPAVLSEEMIRLTVAPEVSEPDYSTAVTLGGFVIPGLIQRRVETVVELGTGQTFAIGGLLSERARATSRKIPGLGDLPVLGPLFSSVDYQSEETELVVLVTPELVEPLSPDQVVYVPGADMVAPNDAELFLEGRLEGRPAEPPLARERHPAYEWPVLPGDLYGAPAGKLRGPIGPAGAEENG